MTLQERIRIVVDELKEQGIDQVDLGKAAGVTKGTVNQWLSGDIKSMKLEYAVGIQKRYGYSALWLVLDEAPKRIGVIDINSTIKSLIKGRFSPLSEEAKSLILCVIRLDALGAPASDLIGHHSALLRFAEDAKRKHHISHGYDPAEVEVLLGALANKVTEGTSNEKRGAAKQKGN